MSTHHQQVKRVLIIGQGGREHAIGWKLSQSPSVKQLYFAPGNGGTASIGENVAIKEDDIQGLVAFAKEHQIDLTVVGPELPLGLGVVDAFKQEKLRIVGPSKAAAQLETSKAFAKQFMQKYQIPTASYGVYSDFDAANNALTAVNYPLVIKADGLASGKGVVICENHNEAKTALLSMMLEQQFGSAGSTVVIEEFLEGKEVSVLCFIDKHTIVPLESAADYKRALDGNMGLNTGGMGSYSPVAYYNESMGQEIVNKTLAAIQAEEMDYSGVIYIGLMLTAKGPMVLEYNVRFGDPETEALLPRLESDLFDIFWAISEQKLAELSLKWSDKACVSVVLASKGYPETFQINKEITQRPLSSSNGIFFHAATQRQGNKILTSGGRVMMVSALGDDILSASNEAYCGVDCVEFDNKYCRRDIGK